MTCTLPPIEIVRGVMVMVQVGSGGTSGGRILLALTGGTKKDRDIKIAEVKTKTTLKKSALKIVRHERTFTL